MSSVPRVLVVDDEADLRELLELTLVGMGLDVDCAAHVTQAKQFLQAHTYSLCLTDMRLPDGNGLELVEHLSASFPNLPVAVLTAYGSAENAVAALKAGAFDYLSKPIALDALRNLVRGALGQQAGQVGGAASTGGRPPTRLLGQSAAIESVREQIGRLARSMAPVSIHGESGSGKELAARLIHESGARQGKPFVAVNCGAIPENLMESEFFGHRKGAFTGADQEREGFFQAAHGGTLFLDEVADLPLVMQVKLLRAIQEKKVRKVGATAEEPVDVRIVSATHQDLAKCVAVGRFRQDLFYRLDVIRLELPALRARTEDIAVLCEAILSRLAERSGMATAPRLSSMCLRFLMTYHFPGNVRELENILERALAFSNGEVVNVEDLGLKPLTTEALASEPADADQFSDGQLAANSHLAGQGGLAQVASGAAGSSGLASARALLSVDGVPESLPDYLDQIEREAIGKALEKTKYNRTAASKLLGISFRALRYRMQRLNLS
jgi:two-component system, NtrC family, response regulator PilR